MIKGIGIDIVKISRIEATMAENPRFISRILTDLEKAESTEPEYVAGRWAAKEALVKAMKLVSFQSVSILSRTNGQKHEPHLIWHEELPDGTVWVSISHEEDIAIAQVIHEI